MDRELEAMQKIAEALADLDDATAMRVVLWIASRQGVVLQSPSLSTSSPTAMRGSVTDSDSSFGDFADLFYRVDPQSNAERALVAAYWLTKNTGESFPGQAINSLLKDLGFQVSNITDALSQNMREKPALIVQIKKGGSTKQARKQYKLTDAGARRIREVTTNGARTSDQTT